MPRVVMKLGKARRDVDESDVYREVQALLELLENEPPRVLFPWKLRLSYVDDRGERLFGVEGDPIHIRGRLPRVPAWAWVAHRAVLAMNPDARLSIEDRTVEGDLVTAEWRMNGCLVYRLQPPPTFPDLSWPTRFDRVLA